MKLERTFDDSKSNIFTNSIYDDNLKQKLKEAIENDYERVKSFKEDDGIYQIKSREDDCNYKYTELMDINTHNTFTETTIPHDIYHIAGDYVKYENGKFSIIDGMDKFTKTPYKYEFCELECCYYTRFGKIDEKVWHLWDYKLEKMFNKAWKNYETKNNLFTDIQIRTQIIINKIASRIIR